MRRSIPIWFVIPIILGACAGPGPRSRSVAPADPPAALSPPVADRPTTAPAEPRAMSADEARAAAETAVREELRKSFEELRQSPEMRCLLTGPTRRFEDAFVPDEVVTFYVGEVSVQIPRELFVWMRPRAIVIGWLILDLKGSAHFSLRHNEDMIVPSLREVPDHLAEGGLPTAVVEALPPGFTTQFREALAERFAFESDYEVRRLLYATDFHDADVDRLSIVDLLSTWTFMQIKRMGSVIGDEYRVELVETPYWHGLGYGALELNGRYVVELNGPPCPVLSDFVCRAERGCDAATLRPVVDPTLASIRPHHSCTPGADMLAEARRIQALPRAEHSEDLVRALVLCAAQYDDAREQALELAAALPQPDWPANRVREYELALHRQEPD